MENPRNASRWGVMRNLVVFFIVAAPLMMVTCDSSTESTSLDDFITDRDTASTRVPTEWETQESVWIQWPQDYEANYRGSFVKIAAVVQQYQPVDILVTDATLQGSAEQMLRDNNVPLTNIRFHIAAYNSIWIRDYGPLYVFDKDGKWLQDWGYNAYGAGSGDGVQFDKDDQVPAAMNTMLGTKYENFNHHILERGNFEANGVDAVALNWDCQKARNPSMSKELAEELYKMVFGATRVIWVDGHDPQDVTTGHIDGILRFVDENTVAIAERIDPADASYSGEAAMLQSAVDAATNLGFNVERYAMGGWVDHNGEELPAMYMNYLVGNGFVLGMDFGNQAWDDAARARLGQLYPGRTVHTIEVNDLWASGGGIHCVTNDEPRLD
jgi:agmatine deiminase